MSAQHHKKTLRIDGVSYDAKTGKPLAKPLKRTTHTKRSSSSAKVHRQQAQSRVLDRAAVSQKAKRKAAPKKITERAVEAEIIAPAPPRVPGKADQVKRTQNGREARYGAFHDIRSVINSTVRFGFSEFSKYGALLLVVMLLGGYIFYLNLDGLALRVAANRAGFVAEVPRYSAQGFDLDRSVESAPGVITLNFSRSDEVGYSITERQSDWDSASLLYSHVERRASSYETYQSKGLTLYVYNGNNATWVSGGIWYDLESNVDLNVQEILDIAGSI